ncbi:carbohydrate ABC transporter permease, partial [Lacisediminihabitans sp.]|uniref:carbohydrate ABC transporter permease n=1 Tax=Lacisediminihabitans sp. TaxID=2787631 RepID=UPI00374CAE96
MTAVVPPTAAPAGRVSAGRRWRRRDLTFDKISFMLVFLVLPVVGYVLFVVWPFIQAFYYSLTDWSGFTPGMNFIGFVNYGKILSDNIFLTAMRNSVTLLFVLPVVTLVISLVFATLVTIGGPSQGPIRGLRNSSLYR